MNTMVRNRKACMTAAIPVNLVLQEVKTMKKLSSTAYALIAIISIVLIVAFTYLWATMTGAVSNIFAGAMVASAVAFIVSLNKCVHFS